MTIRPGLGLRGSQSERPAECGSSGSRQRENLHCRASAEAMQAPIDAAAPAGAAQRQCWQPTAGATHTTRISTPLTFWIAVIDNVLSKESRFYFISWDIGSGTSKAAPSTPRQHHVRSR